MQPRNVGTDDATFQATSCATKLQRVSIPSDTLSFGFGCVQNFWGRTWRNFEVANAVLCIIACDVTSCVSTIIVINSHPLVSHMWTNLLGPDPHQSPPDPQPLKPLKQWSPSITKDEQQQQQQKGWTHDATFLRAMLCARLHETFIVFRCPHGNMCPSCKIKMK